MDKSHKDSQSSQLKATRRFIIIVNYVKESVITIKTLAVRRKLTDFEAFLNKKPTLDELCWHIRVDTEWYKFGVLLKLDTTKLEGIRVMSNTSSFKTVKVFELWLSFNHTSTRRKVIQSLRT